MNGWESNLRIPDGKKLAYKKYQHARYFKLIASPIKHNILPEITLDAFGYNGRTPGP